MAKHDRWVGWCYH